MADKPSIEATYTALKPEQVTDFLRELKTGERIVSIADEQGTDHILVFKKMSRALEVNTRIVYTRMYQTYIKAGVPTRSDARKTFLSLMESNGVDPDTFEDKRQAIQKKLVENLTERTDESTAQNIVQNTEALVQALTQNIKRLTPDEMALLNVISENEQLEVSILSNCAEAMAESDAQLFLMTQTIFKEDGQPLWKDFNEATAETDLVFLSRIREEYQRYLQGTPLFFQVNLPSADQLEYKQGSTKKESPSS